MQRWASAARRLLLQERERSEWAAKETRPPRSMLDELAAALAMQVQQLDY